MRRITYIAIPSPLAHTSRITSIYRHFNPKWCYSINEVTIRYKLYESRSNQRHLLAGYYATLWDITAIKILGRTHQRRNNFIRNYYPPFLPCKPSLLRSFWFHSGNLIPKNIFEHVEQFAIRGFNWSSFCSIPRLDPPLLSISDNATRKSQGSHV
jgi:hypothetical protein